MNHTWLLPESTAHARTVNRDQGAVAYASQLHSILIEHEYRDALEIGSAWGISTLAILDASSECHLTSVDIRADVEAVREIEANGLTDRWTFVVADSREFWTRNDETFDLVFVDGDHSVEGARADVFGAWKALRPGGLLILDDIVHPAHFDIADSTEGYLYGVAMAAWNLITSLDYAVSVGGTSRLAWVRKPSAIR